MEVEEVSELPVVCRDFREYDNDDDTEEDNDDADTDAEEHTDPRSPTDASFSPSYNGCGVLDDE